MKEKKTLSQREQMNYFELLEQAKIDRAWRRANPDPDRCRWCLTNDYRVISYQLAIKACDWLPWQTSPTEDKGKTIELIWYEHTVCNRCHPSGSVKE